MFQSSISIDNIEDQVAQPIVHWTVTQGDGVLIVTHATNVLCLFLPTNIILHDEN